MTAESTFARLPERAAAKFGDREALTFALGVEPGDNVAICMRSHISLIGNDRDRALAILG